MDKAVADDILYALRQQYADEGPDMCEMDLMDIVGTTGFSQGQAIEALHELQAEGKVRGRLHKDRSSAWQAVPKDILFQWD